MKSRPRYEIIVEAPAIAVSDGHYSFDEASRPRQLATYELLREANHAIVELARTEGEAHGLVPDPSYATPPAYVLAARTPMTMPLIPPAQIELPSYRRTTYARLRVRKLPEVKVWQR